MKTFCLYLLICSTLLVFLPVTVHASGNIRGGVVDSVDMEPLAGTNVYIEGTAFGAATDGYGLYDIPNVPAGTYMVKCSYIGYKTKVRQVIVKDDETVRLNFELVIDVFEGNVIEVTAQAEGQAAAINRQLSSNKIINVVSQDRILEIPDANAAESVGRLPGISILREGGEGNKVTIRGLAPTYNSVTIGGDKVPATDLNDRSVDMSMIAPEILSGIEVSKALTPDQEADALGGAIEFTLADAPSGGFRTNFRFQYGYNHQRNDYGQYRGSMTVSDRFFDEKFGIMITGNIESVQRGSDQYRVNWDMLREKESGEEFAPLSATNVRFRYIDDVRKRYGFTALMDYELPDGKLMLNNFFSRLDRSRQTQERRYSVSNNYQYHNWDDLESQIDIMTNSLSGEHKISSLDLDWRLSHSRSYSRLPFNNIVHIREQSAFDYSQLPQFKTPEQIINAARNNLEETYLYELWFDDEKSLERDLAGQVNIELPYSITNDLAGSIKAGVKMKQKLRERDRGSSSSRLDATINRVRVSEKLMYHHTKYGTPGFEYLFTSPAGFAQVANYIDPNFDAEGFLHDRFDFGIGLDGEELNHALASYLLDSLNESSAVRDIDDYELTEKINSFYLMGELNIGQYLMLLPGFRYEQTLVDMTGRKGNVPDDYSEQPLDSPPQVSDTSGKADFDNWFPMVHLKFKPVEWFDLRLAYTKTISRPRLDFLLPKERLDGSARRITLGNPDMLPQLSTNYDAYMSFYSNHLGLIGIGGYYKDIANLIYLRTNRLLLNPEDDGYDPNWKGYNLDKPENSPFKTDVYGIELEWQTNFKWLPSPFNGFVFNINYSHIWSETKYPRTIVKREILQVPPYVINTVVDTFRTGKMINQASDIANVSVGYDLKDFSGRVSFLFQGKTLAAVGDREELDSYTNDYIRWDLLLKYNFTEYLGIYLNLNNFTNYPDRSFTLIKEYQTSEEYYDWTADIGVTVKL